MDEGRFFANLSCLLVLELRYNRPLSFSKTIRLMRLKMTLGTKMEKYHGVRCHSCGETIGGGFIASCPLFGSFLSDVFMVIGPRLVR